MHLTMTVLKPTTKLPVPTFPTLGYLVSQHFYGHFAEPSKTLKSTIIITTLFMISPDIYYILVNVSEIVCINYVIKQQYYKQVTYHFKSIDLPQSGTNMFSSASPIVSRSMYFSRCLLSDDHNNCIYTTKYRFR